MWHRGVRMLRRATWKNILSLMLAFTLPPGIVPAESPASSDGKLGIAIDWSPTKPEREGAMWLSYLMARANFISKHPEAHPQRVGIVTPVFEEELEARSTVTKVYREIRQKDKDLDLPYFNDLLRVDDAAFMREYVWVFLHQASWQQAPEGLRLREFEAWCKSNLVNHQALTKGGIRFAENKK